MKWIVTLLVLAADPHEERAKVFLTTFSRSFELNRRCADACLSKGKPKYYIEYSSLDCWCGTILDGGVARAWKDPDGGTIPDAGPDVSYGPSNEASWKGRDFCVHPKEQQCIWPVGNRLFRCTVCYGRDGGQQ